MLSGAALSLSTCSSVGSNFGLNALPPSAFSVISYFLGRQALLFVGLIPAAAYCVVFGLTQVKLTLQGRSWADKSLRDLVELVGWSSALTLVFDAVGMFIEWHAIVTLCR